MCVVNMSMIKQVGGASLLSSILPESGSAKTVPLDGGLDVAFHVYTHARENKLQLTPRVGPISPFFFELIMIGY